MYTPMLHTRHDQQPDMATPAKRANEERMRLLEDIDRQRVEPEPTEILAMGIILMLFIGAVLAFALAATRMI